MAKRKKTAFPKDDMKVAAIVTGLFAAVMILFFVFSKEKGPHKERLPAPKRITVLRPVKRGKLAAPVPAPVSSQPANFQTLGSIPGSGGKIAIIIDDWGQSLGNCKYLKEIPEPMAVSILPGLRHTRDVADCAKFYHKLTMLHLPLEALHNNDFYPPNYIIKTTMDPALVEKIVEEDLGQLPTIEGVNNHMGSKATADRPLMRLIFRKLKQKGLFFVDSMTSRNSVSAELAQEMGLSVGKRDVFLDNVNTREEIIKQVLVLARKARRRGYAVAIGHDRRLTMQVLKEEIPWLEKQDFEIVSIKEVLKGK